MIGRLFILALLLIWISSPGVTTHAFVQHQLTISSRQVSLYPIAPVELRSPPPGTTTSSTPSSPTWNTLSATTLDRTSPSAHSPSDGRPFNLTSSSPLAGTSSATRDVPSLKDLHVLAATLRSDMKQRASIYRSTIAELQREFETSRTAMQEWQDRYQKRFQRVVDEESKEQQQQERQQSASSSGSSSTTSALFTTAIAELREEALKKQHSSTQKIYWLADQLQQLKFQSHKEQLELAQAAQKRQDELQNRVQELTNELDKQVKQTESQKGKTQELWQRRMDIEAELGRVKREFQETVHELKAKVTSLEAIRVKEQKRAEQQLVEQREETSRILRTMEDEAKAQKQALEHAVQTKNALSQRELKSMKEASQKRELELTNRLKLTSAELQDVKFQSHQQLMAERQAAIAKQDDLLAQIAAKEQELKQQQASTKLISSKADGFWRRRMELEADISTLNQKYEDAVRTWGNRVKELVAARSKDAYHANAVLERTKDEARQQILKLTEESDVRKAELEARLRESYLKATQTLMQIEEAAQRKQQALKESLDSVNNSFQLYKLDTQKRFEKAREDAMSQQNALIQKIEETESMLKQQCLITHTQATKAEENWRRRMELEEELSLLRHKLSDSEALLREQNAARAREHLANQAALLRKEVEARDQLESIAKQVEDQKLVLNKGFVRREKQYRLEIQQIRDATAQREKQLVDKMQSASKELQEYKFQAHAELLNEKKTIVALQNQAKQEIKMKEAELADQVSKSEAQNYKVSELWNKRMALESELSALKTSFKSTVADLDARYKALERTRVKERHSAATEVSRLKAEPTEKLDAALKDVDELKQSIATHKHYTDMEYQKLKLESQHQLTAIKNAAEKKQSDLLDIIKAKDAQLAFQLGATAQSEQEATRIKVRCAELEKEISALKDEHAASVVEWEVRIKAAKDELSKVRLAAENEMARREVEAKDHISSLTAKGLALERELKEKETQYLVRLTAADNAKTTMENNLRAQEREYEMALQQVRDLDTRCKQVEEAWDRDRREFARELAVTKADAESDVNKALSQAQAALKKSSMAVMERESELKDEIKQMSSMIDRLEVLLKVAEER